MALGDAMTVETLRHSAALIASPHHDGVNESLAIPLL